MISKAVRQRDIRAVLLVALALGCCYAVAPPHTPDLAAQVARLSVVRHVASATWWFGWFGGLQLSSYSLLSPRVMAVLGVGL